MIEETFRKDLFNDRVALVTGAARGIGEGIARAFARLGARVVLQDVDRTALERTAEEMARCGAKVSHVESDLAVTGGADDTFAKALAAAGAIHFLVNNAGRSWSVNTAGITGEKTQELIELNLKSVLTLSQLFIVHARERGGGGSVIQVSSTAGIAGFERRAVYCATKFGVIGLTKALALDHARDGIRVNAVLPHVVETDMFRAIAKPHEVKLWRAGIPAGRFAEVTEVAALVMFLCSPASAYLTGGVYPVDGGAMAGPFGDGP